MDSQTQYDNEVEVPDSAAYKVSRLAYVDHRTEYHLQHPAECDLDVLSYEDAQLLDFIKAYPNYPSSASDELWKAIRNEARILAEGEADDADYHTIMSFVGEF